MSPSYHSSGLARCPSHRLGGALERPQICAQVGLAPCFAWFPVVFTKKSVGRVTAALRIAPMIIPVVINPWRAVRFLLIVMITIFGTFAGLYVMQAAFEPVTKVTAIPIARKH
jgi:hypothetical protein